MTKHSMKCIGLLAVALMIAGTMQAAVKTWTASPATNNWATAANWGGVAPVAGDQVMFQASSLTSLYNDLVDGLNLAGIVFNSGASAFTLTGNSITLDGDVTNSAANAQTVNLPLVLSGDRAMVNNGGNLSLNGGISGGYALTKLGGGALYLASSNSFSGGFTLNAGTVIPLNNNAFGTGTITLAGGTIQHITGVALANPIVAQAGTTSYISETTIGNNLDLNGNITGSGSITASAAANYGGVRLGGNNSGYTGRFTVNAGGAQRMKFLAATAGSSNAWWDLNGSADTGSFIFNNGTIYFGALSGGAGMRTGSGNTIEVGALNANSTWSGDIGQASTHPVLRKVGTGTFTISSAQGSGGAVTVSNGTLEVTGSLAAGSTLTVAAGAKLAGSGTIGKAVTLASGNAAISLTNGVAANLTLAGGLTLATGNILNFDVGAMSDCILLTGGSFVATNTVTINIKPLAGMVAGSYNIISNAPGITTNSFVLSPVPGCTNSSLSVVSNTLVLTTFPIFTTWWKGTHDGNWNTTSPGYNWNTDQTGNTEAGGLPGDITDLHFSADGASNLTTTLGRDFGVRGVTFDTAGDVTIGGTNVLTIYGGGLTNTGAAGTNTLSVSNLVLGIAQVWTNGSANPLIVPASVSGSGNVTVSGASTLLLSGNNNFTGAMTVSTNTTVVMSGNNAGRPAGTSGLTTINNGGVLQLQANVGNTTGGMCYALSSQQTANQPLNLLNGSVLQLRSDSDVTFAGANNVGGFGNAGVTIDVNPLNSGNTNHTLTLAPGGFTTLATVINATGGNGYTLQLGPVTSGNNNTLTLNTAPANLVMGGIANVSALTKTGAGTLTLAGASTYGGASYIRQGRVVLSGPFTGNGGIYAPDNNVACTNNVILLISTNVTISQLYLGDRAGVGQVGAAYQTDGNVIITRAADVYCLRIGSVDGGGVGYYKLSGGTLAVNEVGVGANTGGIGVMDITGGTFTDTGYITIGRGVTTSSGVLNCTGGSVSASRIELNWAGTAGAISILNVGGGAGPATVTTLGSTTIGLSLANGSTVNTMGIANLITNGTLTVGIVTAWQGNPVSVLNFNGGTLKATALNAGANFMTSANIDAVSLYGGGATIDDNGTVITISRPLLAPAGSGVTGITVTNKGSGYVGAPLVTITGGVGSGAGSNATAVANMVDDGTGNGTFMVDSITVTCPGQYSIAPDTVTLGAGGGSGAGATLNGIAGNVGGGLVKRGAGTTTLSGACTYSGATVVSNGTLAVNGSLAVASAVSAAPGAAIGGTGTINGPVTISAGAGINLVSGAAGTLSLAGGLTMDSGFLNVDIGAAADRVTVANSMTVSGVSTVNVTAISGVAAGAYTLMTAPTGINLANFTLGALAGCSGSLSVSGDTGLVFTVTSVPSSMWWKGDASALWNAIGNYNWDTSMTGAVDAGCYPNPLANIHFSANGATNLVTTLGQDFSVKSLSFDTPGNVGITGGNVLSVQGGVTNGAATGTNTIAVSSMVLGSNQTWMNQSVNPLVVSSQVSGASVTLTDAGAGTLVLCGSNSALTALQFTTNGIVELGGGSLAINAGGGMTVFSTAGATLNGTGGGSIILAQNDNQNGPDIGTANGTTLTINARITGTSSFENWYVANGTGVTVLTATNDYTGFTIINMGVLSVANVGNQGALASNLGKGTTINISSTSAGNSTLRYTGTGETTDRIINFWLGGNNTGGIIEQSGSGLLKFISNMTVTGTGTKTLTLQGSTSGAGEFAGNIVNGSGTVSVTKAGTGTWTLSGANTYTGLTTVSNGTLVVNGTLAAGSTVNVYSNATLSGKGTLNGAVNVYTGTVIPGGLNSTGTFTFVAASNTLSGTLVSNVRSNGAGGVLSVPNGTLNVASLALSVSDLGQLNPGVISYPVATASNVAGHFLSHNLPPGWGVGYGSTNITIIKRPIGFLLMVQ